MTHPSSPIPRPHGRHRTGPVGGGPQAGACRGRGRGRQVDPPHGPAAGGRARVGAGLRRHARADARGHGLGCGRRDDRAAQYLAHRRPDRRLLPLGRTGHRRRRALRRAGQPAHVQRSDVARRPTPHCHGVALVRDVETRSLARAGQDQHPAPMGTRGQPAPPAHPCGQQRPVPEHQSD